MKCEYGCGRDVKFFFPTVKKWCCSSHWTKCSEMRKKKSDILIGKRSGENNPNYGRFHSIETKRKIGNSKIGIPRSESTKKKLRDFRKGKPLEEILGKEKAIKTKKKISESGIGREPWNKNRSLVELVGKERSEIIKKKIGKSSIGNIPGNKYTIKRLNKKYPTFSKIEKMRYNPDKPGEKEIQVSCKNHNCPNSKEKGGWFTPTRNQISERIYQIEKDYGVGGAYFYCCDECKQECPLYNLRSDPNKIIDIQYTQEEYNIWRQEVLKRADYKCEYCGEQAEHAHHSRPQKLDPFFSLDPDYGIACCVKCHYKNGHSDECSTGKLSSIIC